MGFFALRSRTEDPPLTATLKRLDPTQVELEIPIEPEELSAARDRAFRQLVQHARVPGFRKGKVPRKIFEAQYGTSGIEERAFDEVVPAVYTRAVEEHRLDPVDQPSVELLPIEDGQPLRLKAVVSVRPEITLHAYKGITLTPQNEKADEAAVNETLERLRNDAAALVPVDRPVKMGDVVLMNYAGSIDGTPFEGGTAENAEMEMSDGRFIPGFIEGIVGMSAGESKEIKANFPEGYPNEALSGKEAVFAVTVHDVKERELPALDDEFAQRLGAASAQELRDNVRARLDANVMRQAREQRVSELVDKLIAAHEFAVPAVLVEREVESILDEARQNAARFGMDWEAYLSAGGTDEAALRAQSFEEAERRVRGTLIVEAISKAEHIEASKAEIDAELSELSRRYGQPKDEIRRILRNKMDTVTDGIVRSKTLDLLLEHAKTAPTATNETPARSEDQST
jgi:trigger factor